MFCCIALSSIHKPKGVR